MLTCKQVSNALAKQDYATMSLFQRAGLKLHVALCVVCGKYNRQVMIMQDAARTFRKREDEILSKSGPDQLTAQDKDAIKESLRKAR